MWVVAFFDLPTETKAHKTAYRRFREFLLAEGFHMVQYSVYARPCPTPESADRYSAMIEENLPDEGEVRLLNLTSLQYGRMKCFFGKNPTEPEEEPSQLSFF